MKFILIFTLMSLSPTGEITAVENSVSTHKNITLCAFTAHEQFKEVHAANAESDHKVQDATSQCLNVSYLREEQRANERELKKRIASGEFKDK